MFSSNINLFLYGSKKHIQNPAKISLFQAVKEGNLEKVKELVEIGANPKWLSNHRQTLLHVAAKFGHAYLFELLIEDYQIAVNAADNSGLMALHYTCRYPSLNSLAAAKFLIAKKANVNAISHGNNYTPLHYACESGQVEVVKVLLENKANTKSLNANGETALFQLVCKAINSKILKQDAEIIQLLWNHKPNVTVFAKNNKLLFNTLFALWKDISHSEFITADLSQREIYDEDLEKLASILKKNQFITKLNLRNNRFSHKGVFFLAGKVISTTKTLKSLDLSFNNIGSRFGLLSSGFQYLMEALEENKSIEHLNVSGCELDRSDIQTLLAFLKSGSNTTLKQIDFDISKPIFYRLPPSDQKLIRDIRTRSRILRKITKCQEHLANYSPRENQDEILLWDACKEFLHSCNQIVIDQIENDVRSATIAGGLRDFIDTAKAKKLTDLTKCLSDLLKILVVKNMDKDSTDVFIATFENWMNSLLNASSTIHSTLVKNQIKTPTEKILSIAKNILLGLCGFSKIVEGGGELLEYAGDHLKTAILEGVEIVNKTTDITNIITDINLCPTEIKDDLIRKIHKSTENDKCDYLIKCFQNSQSAHSKIKAMALAIAHHYADILKKVSMVDAEKLAKYAFLHVVDLLILLNSEQKLTADILKEEAILWLAHVLFRHDAIRIDILSKEDILFAENLFTQPAVKINVIKNAIMSTSTCTISTENKNNLAMQDYIYAPRIATQAEVDALNSLITEANVQVDCVVPSDTLIKYLFIFDQKYVLMLQEHHATCETSLSSYQSKSKKIKELKQTQTEMKTEHAQLERRVTELEQNNVENRMLELEQRMLQMEQKHREKIKKMNEKIENKDKEITDLKYKLEKLEQSSSNNQSNLNASVVTNKMKQTLSLWQPKKESTKLDSKSTPTHLRHSL